MTTSSLDIVVRPQHYACSKHGPLPIFKRRSFTYHFSSSSLLWNRYAFSGSTSKPRYTVRTHLRRSATPLCGINPALPTLAALDRACTALLPATFLVPRAHSTPADDCLHAHAITHLCRRIVLWPWALTPTAPPLLGMAFYDERDA